MKYMVASFDLHSTLEKYILSSLDNSSVMMWSLFTDVDNGHVKVVISLRSMMAELELDQNALTPVLSLIFMLCFCSDIYMLF
jgi:hypothetical protein